MEHRLALATMSRWVLSSCIFVTSHAFHIDMVQNMQQKCCYLFISLSPLIYYQRKEPHAVTWNRQRSQVPFFIFDVGRPKLHTSMFSCVHRRSTIWVTAGTSPGTPLRDCWRNHSCAGRSCLPACCVCLLILFYIVYVKKQQQLDLFSCVVICELHLQTYMGQVTLC